MKTKFLAGVGLVAALALSACGGGGTGAASTAASGAAGGATSLTVAADGTGQLAFQQKTLEATANQPINVAFSNPAPLQHNWVLVKPGTEDAVATAGAASGGTVPAGTDGVIAAGALLNQNGTETISVPAQPAGTYTYICTVPGHYAAGMKGTLTVK